VALAVKDTEAVVNYLTKQFYEMNYSLQQRMDILFVLTDAAKELASLDYTDAASSSKAHVQLGGTSRRDQRMERGISLVGGKGSSIVSSLHIDSTRRGIETSVSDEDLYESYREKTEEGGTEKRDRESGLALSSKQGVGSKRGMEDKTRRWGSQKGKGESASGGGKVNRFAAVHGLFFYPLMSRVDSKDNTFNLLGEDSVVLAQLVNTLGVFVECTRNSITPAALERVVHEMLDFLWALRYHKVHDACNVVFKLC